MQAEIISVGTELLLGDILNTNTQWLAQQLAALGFACYHQQVVGDNPTRLAEVVQQAKARSDVLLFTGGLGPTDDDLTKATVAAVFGDTLAEDEEEVERLKSFFCAFGRHMTDNNLKQAMVPVKGEKLPNPNGTAPGAMFADEGRYAFLMPGPPPEMRPMFENHVRPRLAAMQSGVIFSETLRVFGIGESDLENRVHRFLEGTNPTVALYAKTGEVHIRLTAGAENEAECVRLCDEVKAGLYGILGDVIYAEGDVDLETATVQALLETGKTLATAESCTGGLLSGRITAVPGASEAFGFGFVTYANEAKCQLLGVKPETLAAHGAVSGETAGEMAIGARAAALKAQPTQTGPREARDGPRGSRSAVSSFSAEITKHSLGVSTTGVAGPGGGTPEKPAGLVFIAVTDGNMVYLKRINIPGRARAYVRHLATQHALDMVRRLAKGLPQPGTQAFAVDTPCAWLEQPTPTGDTSGDK